MEEALDSYDLSYYRNLVEEKNYSVGESAAAGKPCSTTPYPDQLLIQEYFPFEHVLKTLLELYESILGLKFTRVGLKSPPLGVFERHRTPSSSYQVTDQPVWHEDVVCLAVNDAADGHFIGYCYMDMFPRDGKWASSRRVDVRGISFTRQVLSCGAVPPTAQCRLQW